MRHRLSLDERNEIAFKLRSCFLRKSNPDRLEALADPRFQPNERVIGIYAFEFCLDRLRGKLGHLIEENLAYNVDWSKESLVRDEEPKSMDKLIRMSTTLLMNHLDEHRTFEKAAEMMRPLVLKEGLRLESEELGMFLYEVYYEIVSEVARKLADKLK